jgi:Lar family restriction alleviation protein
MSDKCKMHDDYDCEVCEMNLGAPMTKSRKELMPCPFCGSESIQSYKPNKGHGHYIGCGECGVQIFRCTDDVIGSEAKAIKAWNTRIETSIEAKYAGVVNVLKQLVLLKNTKDKHGKTEAYLELMPITWDKAKKALKELD